MSYKIEKPKFQRTPVYDGPATLRVYPVVKRELIFILADKMPADATRLYAMHYRREAAVEQTGGQKEKRPRLTMG